jgi:4-hydroxyphenylpyruvate dioxygenase
MMKNNPIGLDGFSFLEFATKDRALLEAQFQALGFTRIARHKSKAITLHKQGQILFFINTEKASLAEQFSYAHGASACGMGFNVRDAKASFEAAVNRGASPFPMTVNPGELHFPAIFGIGGSIVYFSDQALFNHYLAENFIFTTPLEETCTGVGLKYIDHLTHNLQQGHMDIWYRYYHDIFNFEQIRYFDIQGKKTGLVSRAMGAPDNKIKIPLNEGTEQDSQIEEFIRDFKGEGIQHIALSTDDIYQTVADLRKNGIDFMDVPDTYYEMIDERLPHHGEDIARMNQAYILIDGDTQVVPKRLLLQIFTKNMLGPVFFEIIQRKGDEGFGEGNFKALFESIERDQMRRGVI